jgi:hypothetical protein
MAAVSPFTLLDNAAIGGSALTPGICTYGLAINIALADPAVMHLDAEGNPDAEFTFSVGSTFATCAGSNIVLEGGAKATLGCSSVRHIGM